MANGPAADGSSPMAPMRWFGGLCERTPEAGRTPPVPPGARLLWYGAVSLWLAGDWASDEVRLVGLPGRRLAVLGFCRASTRELEAALRGSSSTRGDLRLASWPGSYNVIVEDPDGVAVYSDLAGARPVFYARGADGVRFASAALPLAAPTDAAVDPTWLAASLLCPSAPDLVTDRSPFVGVAAVAPGHALWMSRAGLRYHRVWTPRPGSRTLTEGAEVLRAALTIAVAARVSVAARPTADLSGGLNSSTIAWLAASALPEGHGLRALTLDEAMPGNDDLPFARLVANQHPRIEQHVIAVPDTALPYGELADVPLTDEPCPAAPAFARFRLWTASIGALGSDCHLTGHGGDAVLLAPPAYLADLRLGRGLVRHCVAWARLRCRPPRVLITAARAAARTERGRAFRQLADTLLAGSTGTGAAVFEQCIGLLPLPVPAGWFTWEARQLVAERLRQAAETLPVVTAGGVGDAVALGQLHQLARARRTDIQLAHQLGVRLHDPFLDNAVVQICLDVAAAERTSPFAVKPLLQHGLGGVLPTVLLGRRRTKGKSTAAAYRGVWRNKIALRELLADGLLVSCGILDRAAMRKAVDDAGRCPILFEAFDAVIAAELWLRALSRWRSESARPACLGVDRCVV